MVHDDARPPSKLAPRDAVNALMEAVYLIPDDQVKKQIIWAMNLFSTKPIRTVAELQKGMQALVPLSLFCGAISKDHRDTIDLLRRVLKDYRDGMKLFIEHEEAADLKAQFIEILKALRELPPEEIHAALDQQIGLLDGSTDQS